MGQAGQIERPSATSAGGAALVFRAGSLFCALRLDEVIETMRPLQTHPVAGTPPFVLGIGILRGVPAPVIDVARLLGGGQAQVSRCVAVRTERGPVAFATGDVLGVRSALAERGGPPATLPGSTPHQLLAGMATLDARPVLLLSMRAVSDEVWAAAAAGLPS
jgi:purine-binding chemotaxis protein CheW